MTAPWFPPHYAEARPVSMRPVRQHSLRIIAYALAEYRIEWMDLVSGRREARFIKARALVVWALRTLGEPMSYPELARLLGRSCHSTAVNLHQRAIVLRLFEPKFARACRQIARDILVTQKEAYDGPTSH